MRAQPIAANDASGYVEGVARNPVTIRISDELNARLEALVLVLRDKMAGAEVTKASIIRAALDKGLTVLEAEHHSKPAKSSKRK